MPDEIGYAIAILRLIQRTRERAPSDLQTQRIADIVAGLRYAGEAQRSPLLTGLAEALEDWLIFQGEEEV